MATVLRMPEVLAGAVEAVVSAWLVEEGAAFSAGDAIAEIETEKALVDLPAEQDGILGRIIAKPGDSTQVGSPIAVIISKGETDADITAAMGESDEQSVGAIAGTDVPVAPPAEIAAEQAVASEPLAPSTPSTPSTSSGTDGASGRLFASPLARRVVKENGLDLASITGTGPGGRIVRSDVEQAIASQSSTKPQASASAPARPATPQPERSAAGFTEIPHTGMRRAIARRLTESKSTVPHFYLSADCKVDELLTLRKRANEASSTKISVNDFVVKAVAAAFADVPEANVTWTDTALRRWDHVDISVAVATDGGLLTPVVRGVDGLSLSAVASSIQALVEKARAGRLRQDELEGGSFSVTNLGMYGTTEFSAILNPPQSGILAIGAAKPQPVVIDGELAVATVMRVTLSVDHRAVDGALAAQWMAAFVAHIENPITILI